MSREIKCRAWSTKWKRMILPDDEDYTIDVHAKTAWRDTADDECIALMQYIGIKDKNGIEIFEFDIVRDRQMMFQIIYKAPSFLLLGTNGSEYVIELFRFQDAEVIGNIFDTPWEAK